ncbi:MAG: conserved hypothetical protein of unknown function [Frankiales bacterium]|nr:conserved hypothetical protein of unknown function [Frankiales bacterium]
MVKLRGDDVIWREVESELVVLDLRSSRYLKVNGAGTVLWPLLVEGADEPALVERLVSRFALPPEQAAADVAAFLVTLRERALLTTA